MYNCSFMAASPLRWTRIERIALYLALLTFFVVQLLSLLDLEVFASVSTPAANVFLATCLLLGVHHLIKTVEGAPRGDGLAIHESYSAAFQDWIEAYSEIDEMIILASTSLTQVEHLRLQPRRIKTVKLLVFNDRQPGLKQGAEAMSESIDLALPKWKRLVDDRQVKRVVIRYFSSAASFYFAIANRERVIVGLLRPHPDGEVGPQPAAAAAFSADSRTSRSVVNELVSWHTRWWQVASPVMEYTRTTSVRSKN